MQLIPVRTAIKDFPNLLDPVRDLLREVVEQGPYSAPELTYEDLDAKLLAANSGWRICLNDSGDLVGLIGYYNYQPIEQMAEVAIGVRSEFRGTGQSQAMAGMFLAWGLMNLNVRRINMSVLASNTASNEMAKSLGFVHEGTLRKVRFYKGQFTDINLYGWLNTDLPLPTSKEMKL